MPGCTVLSLSSARENGRSLEEQHSWDWNGICRISTEVRKFKPLLIEESDVFLGQKLFICVHLSKFCATVSIAVINTDLYVVCKTVSV